MRRERQQHLFAGSAGGGPTGWMRADTNGSTSVSPLGAAHRGFRAGGDAACPRWHGTRGTGAALHVGRRADRRATVHDLLLRPVGRQAVLPPASERGRDDRHSQLPRDPGRGRRGPRRTASAADVLRARRHKRLRFLGRGSVPAMEPPPRLDLRAHRVPQPGRGAVERRPRQPAGDLRSRVPGRHPGPGSPEIRVFRRRAPADHRLSSSPSLLASGHS